MLNKDLLFVSFNHSLAFLFNPKKNCVNSIPLNSLNNLTAKNTLIVCNKQLLTKVIPSNNLKYTVKDILYLYAVLFPVKFTSGSIIGLAKTLELPHPHSLEKQASTLYNIYCNLLSSLSAFSLEQQKSILAISNFMAQNNNTWEWHTEITKSLPFVKLKDTTLAAAKVWKNFSNVETTKKQNTANHNYNNISEEEVLTALNILTQKYQKTRGLQKEYALAVAKVFNNSKTAAKNSYGESIDSSKTSAGNSNISIDSPTLDTKTKIAFAEAGTGIGKTIGYLAAVIAFIKNNPTASIIISTFSKALQQQILLELPANLQTANTPIKATLIKGNQNYVCLLNIEYILNSINNYTNGPLFLGFILRWLQETTSGDLAAGDFLSFLKDIISKEIIDNALNKKDECLYSKCSHYKKCFITKVKEAAKNSNIIISNHSLTLLNNFNSDYFIFDEAHSLYHVSDEAYGKEISANKALFLKNWLLGAPSKLRSSKTLLNGLQARLSTILALLENNSCNVAPKVAADDSSVTNNFTNNTNHLVTDITNLSAEPQATIELQQEALDLKIKNLTNTLVYSSSFLPSSNYLSNIIRHTPIGAFEEFLYEIYNHILLHNSDLDQYYSIESLPINLEEKLQQATEKLLYQLRSSLKVAENLRDELKNKLEITAKEQKSSLVEFIAAFEYNCIDCLNNFIELLNDLKNPQQDYIYRFSLVKEENTITNIGYFKNYINPFKAFSQNLVNSKKGIVFTSATLLDCENNNNNSLIAKFALNEAQVEIVSNITLKSPFDYAKNSKIIILNSNYSKNNAMRQEALLQLFLAAQGGVLAIFTSLIRLKNNYQSLATNFLLNENNIEVIAQVDKNKSSSSIINLFKENEHSCLMGSDSFRDGIDIPGKALRMVVFEKVPWLRKNILNKARKAHFGKELEFENIRFKLRQAFGRIIRSEQDKGIFVLLEPGLPSEFLSAFPSSVEVHKISLEEAISLSKLFLQDYSK